MSFQITLCHNTTCSQPVPDSLNKGVRRIYCSPRCSSQQAQRNYRARVGGTSGDGYFRTVNGHPYLSRAIAPSAAAAERRFKMHLTACAVGSGLCPSRVDPYDRYRRCLIHAVLREDWDVLRRAEMGVKWEREKTTPNGFWIETPDTATSAVDAPVEVSDLLSDFVEAGGGDTSVLTL